MKLVLMVAICCDAAGGGRRIARCRCRCVGWLASESRTGFSSPTGDESMSYMVEDTDFEDGSVDVDGDVDRGERDFDTGTLGISVNIPSQVA